MSGLNSRWPLNGDFGVPRLAWRSRTYTSRETASHFWSPANDLPPPGVSMPIFATPSSNFDAIWTYLRLPDMASLRFLLAVSSIPEIRCSRET